MSPTVLVPDPLLVARIENRPKKPTKDEKIQSLKNDLALRDQTIAEQQAKIAELEQQVIDLRLDLEHRDTEMPDANDAKPDESLAAIYKKLDEMQQQLDSNSTSNPIVKSMYLFFTYLKCFSIF